MAGQLVGLTAEQKLARHRRQTRAWHERHRQAGLCYDCGDPSDGMWRCQACRDRVNACRRAVYRRYADLQIALRAALEIIQAPYVFGDVSMPKILDDAVKRIKQRGVATDAAYPIAVASLQRAGDLKRGTLKATSKGAKRGAMSQAQREKTR